MKLFENGVGRPSNEILKKRRMFIASIAIAIAAVLFIGVYALSNLNLSNLTGEAKKVDVSYKAGTQIKLSKVKVYTSSKSKISLIRKSGTYYIWSNVVENNRIRITNSKGNVGNNKKITGWVNINDLNAQTTKTTTSTQNYAKGTIVMLDNAKIYLTSTSKKSIDKRKGFYYVHSKTMKNGRIKIGIYENSMSLGWINVNDVVGTGEKNSIEITYQNYNAGDILSLVKKTQTIDSKKVTRFYRPTNKSDEVQNYTVIFNSNTKKKEVKVKDVNGKIYSVSKQEIAGAYIDVEKDSKTYRTYYHLLSEALKAATSGMNVTATCNVFEDTITINDGVTLSLEKNVTNFHNIVNNGKMIFVEEITANEISGVGEFHFSINGSIVLTGDKGINSTELKFNVLANNSSNDLTGRSIITIANELAIDNIFTAVGKIIDSSFNDQYNAKYVNCSNSSSSCKGIGQILLIKK